MYSDKKILITISGYYERFQINTIESCIKRAKHPERLSFAIAYHEDHKIDTSNIANKISRYIIPKGTKTGVQKAKNILFSMLLDEDFILSIDSHVIMMPDWDEELLADYEARLLRAENKKIVISGNFGNETSMGGLDYEYCLKNYFNNDKFFAEKRENEIVDFISDGDYKRLLSMADYYGTMIQTVPQLDHISTDYRMELRDRELTNIYSGNFSFYPRSWIDEGWNISAEMFFSADQPESAMNIFTSGYDVWRPRWKYHAHMSDHDPDMEFKYFMLGHREVNANRYFDIERDMAGIKWFLRVINNGYPGQSRPRSVADFFEFFELDITKYPENKLELYNLVYKEIENS
jgi:hypothetical protein